MYKTVGGQQVELTAFEEAEVRSEWAESDIRQAASERAKKVNKLLDAEKQKALDAIIVTEKTAIENMDDTALDAELARL